MEKKIPLRSGLTDPALALLRERAANPEVKTQYGLPDADTRSLSRRVTDPLNRGLIAASLGAPVDLTNVALNLLRAGYGTAGHAMGLLKVEDMPNLDEKPFGGSEHIGDIMNKYGIVSEHRDPMLEMAAGLLPLAPKGLSMAVNATRPGRNMVRMVKGTDPVAAALDELSRKVSNNERAVKVSKRGWVGPIAEGDATSVADIRNPGIFKAEELVHTHPMNADATFNPLSSGDRSSIPVSAVHTEPNGRLTAYRERLGSGQPPTFDDYVRQEDYVNALMKDPTYSTNVDPAQYKAGWLDPKDVSAYSGENLGAQVASEVSPVDRLWLDSLRGGEAPAAEAQVVKPKGGNWLTEQDDMYRIGTGPERYVKSLTGPIGSETDWSQSLAKWGNTQLKKYIQNEMATPEDPVRQLADTGITHKLETERLLNQGSQVPSDYTVKLRENQDFPTRGLAQTDLGRIWENITDDTIKRQYAGNYAGTAKGAYDPWLSKVPPDTPVYGFRGDMDTELEYDTLGFKHLMDELQNSIRPNSDLPLELRMKYNSLDRLSVPQAVERVHKINEWRAQQAIEANQALANNAATVLHKEYPDVGMKWVQLRQPEALTDDQIASFAKDIRVKKSLGDDPAVRGRLLALQDALKYEGDTMGHCVGGYCDQVADGRTNIFSLRDEKGRPHVTVEVRPAKNRLGYELQHEMTRVGDLPEEERLAAGLGNSMNPDTLFHPRLGLFSPDSFADDIVQIKGKGNAKPADKYLPMVQDFIRSQKWGKVGDLYNSGMFQGEAIANDTFHPIRTKLVNTLNENYPDMKLSNSDLSEMLKGKYYANHEELIQDLLNQVGQRQQ